MDLRSEKIKKNRKFRILALVTALTVLITGCGLKEVLFGTSDKQETVEAEASAEEEPAADDGAAAEEASGQSVFDFMGDSGFTRLRSDMEAGEVPVECKVRYETKNSQPDVRVRDPETITELYNDFAQIRVLEQAPQGSSGITHIITFRLRNDTYVACRFDDGKYICRGTERYMTSGSEPLLSGIQQIEETALAKAAGQNSQSEKSDTGASSSKAGSTAANKNDGSVISWETGEDVEDEESQNAAEGRSDEVSAEGQDDVDKLVLNKEAHRDDSAQSQAASADKKEDVPKQKETKTDPQNSDPGQDKNREQPKQKEGEEAGHSRENPEEGTGIAVGSSQEDPEKSAVEAAKTAAAQDSTGSEQSGAAVNTGNSEKGQSGTAVNTGNSGAGQPDLEELPGNSGTEQTAMTADAGNSGAGQPDLEEFPGNSGTGQSAAAARPDTDNGGEGAAKAEPAITAENAYTEIIHAYASAMKLDKETFFDNYDNGVYEKIKEESVHSADSGNGGTDGGAAVSEEGSKAQVTAADAQGGPASDDSGQLTGTDSLVGRGSTEGSEDSADGQHEGTQDPGNLAGKKDKTVLVKENPEKLLNYNLLWQYFAFSDSESTLLYGVRDYNEDGIPELAVAIGTEEYPNVWAVYTFDGQKAVELFTGTHSLGERTSLYCLPDNTFLISASGGAFAGSDTICRISKGGKGLEIIEEYSYDEQANGTMDYISDSGRISFEEYQERYWKKARPADEEISFEEVTEKAQVKSPVRDTGETKEESSEENSEENDG